MVSYRALGAAALLVLAHGFVSPVSAADAPSFAGQTITVIIGATAGGAS